MCMKSYYAVFSKQSFPQPLHHKFKKSSIGGIEDTTVCVKISPAERDDCKSFCYDQLSQSQNREDYKELLQLALIFLAVEWYNYHTPDPTSHARWISKAIIYSFKIFLFRDQFSLTKKETNGLRDICIFLAKLYIKAYFGCTNAIDASLQDLTFIQDTIKYSKTDTEIASIVLKKMSNHLWYIAEETVALTLFRYMFNLYRYATGYSDLTLR